MRRIKLVLAVAAMIVAMLTASAGPAMADIFNGNNCDRNGNCNFDGNNCNRNGNCTFNGDNCDFIGNCGFNGLNNFSFCNDIGGICFPFGFPFGFNNINNGINNNGLNGNDLFIG